MLKPNYVKAKEGGRGRTRTSKDEVSAKRSQYQTVSGGKDHLLWARHLSGLSSKSADHRQTFTPGHKIGGIGDCGLGFLGGGAWGDRT